MCPFLDLSFWKIVEVHGFAIQLVHNFLNDILVRYISVGLKLKDEGNACPSLLGDIPQLP